MWRKIEKRHFRFFFQPALNRFGKRNPWCHWSEANRKWKGDCFAKYSVTRVEWVALNLPPDWSSNRNVLFRSFRWPHLTSPLLAPLIPSPSSPQLPFSLAIKKHVSSLVGFASNPIFPVFPFFFSFSPSVAFAFLILGFSKDSSFT